MCDACGDDGYRFARHGTDIPLVRDDWTLALGGSNFTVRAGWTAACQVAESERTQESL